MSENDGKLSGDAYNIFKAIMNLFAGEPGVIVPTPNRRKCNIKRKNDIRSIILEALEGLIRLLLTRFIESLFLHLKFLEEANKRLL